MSPSQLITLDWKKIEDKMQVSQFLSTAKSNDYGKSKIYLKLFEPLDPHSRDKK